MGIRRHFDFEDMRMSAFSEWVRLRRLEKGLTQKEASEQLGVGKSMVGMFESQERMQTTMRTLSVHG